MVQTADWVVKVTMRIYTTSKIAGGGRRIAERRGKPNGIRLVLNTSGFTVVEVLLVVVIIALIASVSGGFYAGTYKNMLAKKSARDFLLAAKYAKITAIERQSPCKIEVDTANNRFGLVIEQFNEETGETEQVMVRDFYFKPVKFGGDIKFEDIRIKSADSEEGFEADEQNTIVFSPNGTARSALVQIGDGKNHYTVSISAATGRAKMHFGTAKEVKTNTVDLDQAVRWY